MGALKNFWLMVHVIQSFETTDLQDQASNVDR